MSIQRHQVSDRMSKVVVHNSTVYLCGQVAKDRSAEIKEQTRSMLEKVSELLFSVGSCPEKILYATIYLKNISDFDEMNQVWDTWTVKGCAPARACVEAKMASPELLVEISVVAAL